jgi:predicted GNAT family N-acyltransferase
MLLQAAAFRGERRLVHGDLVYVFADPATQTSKSVPPVLREWFTAFEDGVPMVSVQTGAWSMLGTQAQAVRRSVFTEEQGIDAALDNDGADATALHAVARNRMGMALGTARMLAPAPGMAKIGRMAVLAPMRGTQIGRQMLQALIGAARHRGDHEVLLHAQSSAVGFYRRAGFEARGAAFHEAGIEHQEMVLRL